MEDAYDLVVIGAGPGGYSAALTAAAGGLKTLLVEMDAPGGTCLNRGCIPAKALLHAAHAGDFRKDEALGHAKRVVEGLRKGLSSLFSRRGVEVLQAVAVLEHGGRLRAGDRVVSARNVVIATGSEASYPPGLAPDSKRILGSDDVLEKGVFPSGEVVVLGGGIVGMEFADLFSAAGCQVSVVELLPQVLAGIDGEMRRELLRLFKRRRVRILTGTACEGAEYRGDRLEVRLSGGEALSCDYLVVVTGRRARLEGIDVAALGLSLNEEKRIAVDDTGRAADGIYAIGDVAGTGPMLAHAASHQGIAVAEYIATGRRPGKAPVAAVLFTRPELAWVGMTEEEARAAFGDEILLGRCPMRAIGRAHAIGQTAGLVKVIGASDGRLLGVHALAENAGEFIGTAQLALKLGARLQDLADLPLPHPTLSEALFEAARAAAGSPLNTV